MVSLATYIPRGSEGIHLRLILLLVELMTSTVKAEVSLTTDYHLGSFSSLEAVSIDWYYQFHSPSTKTATQGLILLFSVLSWRLLSPFLNLRIFD